jgi:hypothetical protein
MSDVQIPCDNDGLLFLKIFDIFEEKCVEFLAFPIYNFWWVAFRELVTLFGTTRIWNI